MTAWKIGKCLTDRQATEPNAYGKASHATEPAALFRIGCVYGVLPDKWQRRWSENRPDVPSEWAFMDATEQWSQLRDEAVDIVLARVVTDPVDLESVGKLSYAPEAHTIPAELREQINCVELYHEKLAVIARKKHDCTLVDAVSEADWESFTDPRIGSGELVIPDGQPELALTYAESGAGVGVMQEALVKALGADYTGVAQPLLAPPATRICAIWLRKRTESTESIIQEFIGALRGRRARSARSATAGGTNDQDRKEKRRQKIAANRRKTQASNQQQRAARKKPARSRRRRS